MIGTVPFDVVAPRVLKLPFDFCLHVVVGYTAARLLFGRWGWVGAIGGTVPNLDWFIAQWTALPIAHRGLFHTPFFLVAVVAGGRLLRIDAPILAGFAVGYLLELATDTFEGYRGIMWLYPLSPARLLVAIHVPELYWGTAVFLACGTLLVWERQRRPLQ